MKQNILEEISDFIQMCEREYDEGNCDEVESAWEKVSDVFGKVIPDYFDCLCGPDSPRGDMRLQDLPMIIAKLRIFAEKLEYDASRANKAPTSEIVEMTRRIDVEAPFVTAVKLVVDDDETFADEEKTELMNRIQELKGIALNGGDKASKWEKVRPIFDWVGKQGASTAALMMPLVSDAMK